MSETFAAAQPQIAPLIQSQPEALLVGRPGCRGYPCVACGSPVSFDQAYCDACRRAIVQSSRPPVSCIVVCHAGAVLAAA
jgi:hypothetical protein